MSQDYHYQKIANTCPVTGYPMDEWGHHLDPEDKPKDRPDQARELTNPYGVLGYAIGNGDDFVCFDFRVIRSRLEGNKGTPYIILHATINSETAGYIDRAGYELLPLGPEVADAVMGMMDARYEDVPHSKTGWNQDVWFFYRDVSVNVAQELGREVPEFSSRQLRLGGKRIEAWVAAFWASLRKGA